MESGILGFGIRSTAQGIRNPGGLESGIQVVPANNPESGAHKQQWATPILASRRFYGPVILF